MGVDATKRRRRFGALMLLAALGMLVAGQTILKNRLKDFGFLVYWLFCFIFTGAAIVAAFLDARSLQRRSRREARELIETTFTQIQKDAKERRPGRNPK
jgi:hypothetical protein